MEGRRRRMINRASMTWLGSPWDSDLTIKSGACWVARQNGQVAPRSIIKHIDYYVIYSAKHRAESGLMDMLPSFEMSIIASSNLDCTFFICTFRTRLNSSRWKLLPRHSKCLICCHMKSMMDGSTAAFYDDSLYEQSLWHGRGVLRSICRHQS
jgi:hypothetical protein